MTNYWNIEVSDFFSPVKVCSGSLAVYDIGFYWWLFGCLVNEKSMELMAPFQFSYEFSEAFLLLFALLTGIAFGMFLEKAGFGNARKLVQQFYNSITSQ